MNDLKSGTELNATLPCEATETMLHAAYQACDDFIDEHGDGEAPNLDDGQWNEMMAAVWRRMLAVALSGGN